LSLRHAIVIRRSSEQASDDAIAALLVPGSGPFLLEIPQQPYPDDEEGPADT
jgi:hypothetical protein